MYSLVFTWYLIQHFYFSHRMPKQIAFIVACNATILCKGVRAASRALMISLSIIGVISWESWGC